MIIRPLKSSDSMAELTTVVRSAYQQLADLGFRYWGTHQNEEDTKSRCEQGHCLVVEDEGRLVATVIIKKDEGDDCPQWYQQNSVMVITQFAVIPELQKQGIGSQLVKECEKIAFNKGASEVALDTADGATHLINFYDKRGYRHVERYDYNGTNYVSVVMSKRIRPTLTTDRLVLRDLEESDRKPFQSYWSDQRFKNFYPPDRLSAEHCDETIDEALKRLSKFPRNSHAWAITKDGETIGRIRLDLPKRNSLGDIGYELSPEHWGQGFATETLTEVVRYSFEELKLHRLQAWAYGRNKPSQNVLRKCGFTLEGTLKNRCSWGDGWVDDLIFGLLVDDYKS